MKLSVIAFVYILSLFCLAVIVDEFGSLSCCGTVNATCITMGYNREQLIALRNDFTNSTGYVSILKKMEFSNLVAPGALELVFNAETRFTQFQQLQMCSAHRLSHRAVWRAHINLQISHNLTSHHKLELIHRI